MKPAWSFHAKDQLAAILRTIAREQSRECASHWNEKLYDAAENLSEFPESGGVIPNECFSIVPDHADRIRQTLCKPYRIVYERVGKQIRILAIMHYRMQIKSRDISWN